DPDRLDRRRHFAERFEGNRFPRHQRIRLAPEIGAHPVHDRLNFGVYSVRSHNAVQHLHRISLFFGHHLMDFTSPFSLCSFFFIIIYMLGRSAPFTKFEHEGWEGVAENYDATWATSPRQFIPPLLDAAEVLGQMSILDVGCGPGYVSAVAAERGAIPTGLD